MVGTELAASVDLVDLPRGDQFSNLLDVVHVTQSVEIGGPGLGHRFPLLGRKRSAQHFGKPDACPRTFKGGHHGPETCAFQIGRIVTDFQSILSQQPIHPEGAIFQPS